MSDEDYPHWINRIYDRFGPDAGDALVIAACVLAVVVIVALATVGGL